MIAVRGVISGTIPDLVIDAENSANFEFHPDTKAETAISWRKQQASNDWVEGEYTTSAVRGNVEETLAIWVNGATSSIVELNKYELERRLNQMLWSVALTIDGVTSTWTCSGPAQYQISTKHEYMHMPTALVTAKLSRLPRKTITGAFGTRTL